MPAIHADFGVETPERNNFYISASREGTPVNERLTADAHDVYQVEPSCHPVIRALMGRWMIRP